MTDNVNVAVRCRPIDPAKNPGSESMFSHLDTEENKLMYGQTASGKTHSMGTSPESMKTGSGQGILPRAATAIFDRIDEKKELKISVDVTFVELYGDKVLDLLKGKQPVKIRFNGKEVLLPGANRPSVSNAADLMAQLKFGLKNRTTGSTRMNDTSSRSHAIFTIHLKISSAFEDRNAMNAKVHFVDLAGSETLSKTLATGKTQKEGININGGLYWLGRVIDALVDGSSHVPYRNDSLTWILQDSLGGNAQTLLIACISAADAKYEESLLTLRYAQRARRIKNKPNFDALPALNRARKELAISQQQPDDARLSQLQVENEQLRRENEKLLKGLADVAEKNKNLLEIESECSKQLEISGGQLEAVVSVSPAEQSSALGEILAAVNKLQSALAPEVASSAALLAKKPVADMVHDWRNRLEVLYAQRSKLFDIGGDWAKKYEGTVSREATTAAVAAKKATINAEIEMLQKQLSAFYQTMDSFTEELRSFASESVSSYYTAVESVADLAQDIESSVPFLQDSPAAIKLSTTWKIENFVERSMIPDETGAVTMESGHMADLEHSSLPGLKWDMNFVPFDPSQATAKAGFAGLFVYANFGECEPPIQSLFAEWKATLLDEDGSERASYASELHEFIPLKKHNSRIELIEDNWGHSAVFAKADIDDAIGSDESLAIRVDITVVNIAEVVKCRKLLQKIHKNMSFPDLVVKVGDQTFPVHQTILAESSVEFENLLKNQSGIGTAIKEIVLNDTTPTAFKAFIGAIYYDNWDFLADLNDIRGVLYLAEKYKVPDLKSFCDVALAEKITAENAMVILTETAALYDAPKSKGACAKFFGEFKQSDVRLDFQKDHEEVALEIWNLANEEKSTKRKFEEQRQLAKRMKHT